MTNSKNKELVKLKKNSRLNGSLTMTTKTCCILNTSSKHKHYISNRVISRDRSHEEI